MKIDIEIVTKIVSMAVGRAWKTDQALRGQCANKKLAREILAAQLIDLGNLEKYLKGELELTEKEVV